MQTILITKISTEEKDTDNYDHRDFNKGEGKSVKTGLIIMFVTEEKDTDDSEYLKRGKLKLTFYCKLVISFPSFHFPLSPSYPFFFFSLFYVSSIFPVWSSRVKIVRVNSDDILNKAS